MAGLSLESAAICDLNKFTPAFAAAWCPQGVLGSEDFSRVIIEKDDSQFCRFLPMRLGYVRCWFPNDILSAKCFPLENEVVQSSRVAISVARFRPLSDCNLDGYREFFQGHPTLIMR